MRSSSGRHTLALALPLIWYAACGGETGRHTARGTVTAGESGSVDVLAGAGGASKGHAGASESMMGKGGATLEGGGGARGGAPSSQSGGVGGMTAASGEPSAAGASAAGANAAGAGGAFDGGGAAGEGGAAGAAPSCCQPLHCADVIPGLDCAFNPFRDGCGASFFCGCAAGDECRENKCVPCDPGPDPCGADLGLCGATTDRCGNAINCADECLSRLGALGTCYGGHCCQRMKTTCTVDDCGFMSDNCGGFIDCTGTVCEVGSCQPSGKCCAPSVTCESGDCGFKPDGCGNYLDCGNACTGDKLCMENHCHDSVCKLGGFECDLAYNIAVDGYEYCGTCPQGQGCFRHQCLPLCSAAGP